MFYTVIATTTVPITARFALVIIRLSGLTKTNLNLRRRIITQISDSIKWTSVSNGDACGDGGGGSGSGVDSVQVHQRHRPVLGSVVFFNLRL